MQQVVAVTGEGPLAVLLTFGLFDGAQVGTCFALVRGARECAWCGVAYTFMKERGMHARILCRSGLCFFFFFFLSTGGKSQKSRAK